MSNVLLLLGTLAAIYLVGVPLARRGLLRRRRRAADSWSDKVLVSWQEAEDVLALAGHPRRRSETNSEYAVRSSPVVGDAGPQLARLAEDASAAGFSPAGVPPEAVPDAERAVEAVAGELRAQASAVRRLRWALDPRPLLGAVKRRG
jgi:hypothetical protein